MIGAHCGQDTAFARCGAPYTLDIQFAPGTLGLVGFEFLRCAQSSAHRPARRLSRLEIRVNETRALDDAASAHLRAPGCGRPVQGGTRFAVERRRNSSTGRFIGAAADVGLEASRVARRRVLLQEGRGTGLRVVTMRAGV